MQKSGVILVLFAILTVPACTQKVETSTPEVDKEHEKQAVEQVINRMVEAQESRDIEMFSAVMAHDPDMVTIGTDAAEFWVGWQPLHDSIDTAFQTFDSSTVSLTEQHTTIADSGTTAWFAALADWTIESSGETAEIDGMRLTAVLEKRNGNWLIVQMHASVPVQGQVAKY